MDRVQEVLRFVTFLAPEMQEVYADMVTYVGDRLGAGVSVQVGAHDYDVFARGEADFGFI
jgi:hypothetical protein